MTERRFPRSLVLVLLASSAACSGWEAREGPSSSGGQGEGGANGADCPEAFNPKLGKEAAVPRGFRVVGPRIEDGDGNAVVFRGVNRSGSEYQCSKGSGFFDGAVDERAVRAMTRWGINAVRVPLNETCWLSGGGLSSQYTGTDYKKAIGSYVALLERYGLTPILDLHWAAPGDTIPQGLLPMPNADHSVDFWTDVAETFSDDDAVVFEPYNEPFPDHNSLSDAAWACWRDGCDECVDWGCNTTYEAVGMQALVDAIRSTGSKHLILLGGVQFSNDLTGWLDSKPNDPIDNLAPAWHIYQKNRCASVTCWDSVPLEISKTYPIVVTELGESDCEGDFVATLTEWLEKRKIGYLAWSWNAFGACVPETQQNSGNAYSLITSYACPEPNGGFADAFYQALQDHVP